MLVPFTQEPDSDSEIGFTHDNRRLRRIGDPLRGDWPIWIVRVHRHRRHSMLPFRRAVLRYFSAQYLCVPAGTSYFSAKKILHSSCSRWRLRKVKPPRAVGDMRQFEQGRTGYEPSCFCIARPTVITLSAMTSARPNARPRLPGLMPTRGVG